MKITYSLFLIIFVSTIYCQTKQIEINGTEFSFITEQNDSDNAENKVVKLYRANKEILTHTLFFEEGDCSSINIQLGNYSVKENEIIFYSYWAVCDRMPGMMMPYGFMKQVYTVENSGFLKLKNAKIYIEDFVEIDSIEFFETNRWQHKGLKYLYETPKNNSEQLLLNRYIQKIEKKYSAKFVLNSQKQMLENEVRKSLQNEIQEHTGNWVEGEIYGKVKK